MQYSDDFGGKAAGIHGSVCSDKLGLDSECIRLGKLCDELSYNYF